MAWYSALSNRNNSMTSFKITHPQWHAISLALRTSGLHTIPWSRHHALQPCFFLSMRSAVNVSSEEDVMPRIALRGAHIRCDIEVSRSRTMLLSTLFPKIGSNFDRLLPIYTIRCRSQIRANVVLGIVPSSILHIRIFFLERSGTTDGKRSTLCSTFDFVRSLEIWSIHNTFG